MFRTTGPRVKFSEQMQGLNFVFNLAGRPELAARLLQQPENVMEIVPVPLYPCDIAFDARLA